MSPAPKVGLKYKPLSKEPSNYVDRLHETSASAPKARHKPVYGRWKKCSVQVVVDPLNREPAIYELTICGQRTLKFCRGTIG